MAEILHQLIGSLSHYLQGFIHPSWCRISSINGRRVTHPCIPLNWLFNHGILMSWFMKDSFPKLGSISSPYKLQKTKRCPFWAISLVSRTLAILFLLGGWRFPVRFYRAFPGKQRRMIWQSYPPTARWCAR